MEWKDGTLPVDRYMFTTFAEKTIADCLVDDPSTVWCQLEEADDRIENLMRWVYSYHVLNTDDSRVCCFEQTVFEVKNTEWPTGTEWMVGLEIFDYWNSTDLVVFFRLAP